MIETELRSTYLLGHTDDELLRLERQAAFFAEETEETLRRAGLAPGMRVLDLGCGVGDVAVAAATIVGPDGAVLGLDRSRDAVTVANRRLTAYGLDWARCEEGDVLDRDGAGFDAVVGRFILMHLVDPVALLDQFRRGLGAGGILAFIEMDIDSAAITPSMPLFERCVAAIISVYQRAGSEPNMGARLFATFRQKINKVAGRDHWSPVSGALLAGGGMKVGQVIGSTDKLGAYAASAPIHYLDVLATVYHNLGIDPHSFVTDQAGRPVPILPGTARPIERLI